MGLSAVVRSRDDSGLEWMKSLKLESVEFLPDLLAVLAVRAAHDRNGTCRSPTALSLCTVRILYWLDWPPPILPSLEVFGLVSDWTFNLDRLD